MPIARLSGRVEGRKDPGRKTRAKTLYKLFNAGWDIYNGNGDQEITLHNIQKTIIESDAFVFTPSAALEDMFQAASISVGYQTNDKDLEGKTAVILNNDDSWTPFLDLIRHLHGRKTVKQLPEEFLTVVHKTSHVLNALEEQYIIRGKTHMPEPEPDILIKATNGVKHGDSGKPEYSVCVFCSASTREELFLNEGFLLGQMLAMEGWGCITGAGKTGIMGKVVQGAVSKGGWTGGSNIPHIIALEGLPEGLSDFWPRADIYTRMEVMIEHSSAFIVLPGGIGTLQEVLAMVLLKKQGNDLMRDKPIIIVNHATGHEISFWDPLIALLFNHGMREMVHVVNSATDAVSLLKNKEIA